MTFTYVCVFSYVTMNDKDDDDDDDRNENI